MSGSTAFTIGSEVSGSDEVCGELRRVVVDPVARALVHLVVEPPHRAGAARLVPVGLVESSADGAIRLSCTKAEFEALEEAEDTQFLAGAGADYGYGPGQVVSLPYFGLGGMGMGMGGVGSLGMGGMGMGGMAWAWAAPIPGPRGGDRPHPGGEVAVRRGDP